MNSHSWIDQICNQALPLEKDSDLDVLVDAIGDCPIVLLGESSHGTSEFYILRAELSKRLIQHKGFSFIAVEGDWPSCYEINRFVKQYPETPQDNKEVLQSFNRWPTWMWANKETADFISWIQSHNAGEQRNKVGFYGLDVYSLWESMEEIIRYLEKIGSKELQLAKEAFSCFEPFTRNAQTYGVSAADILFND